LIATPSFADANKNDEMLTKGVEDMHQIDYSQDNSWASKPDQATYPVDVFYVFPTIYSEEYPLNMDIMNRPDLQAKALGLMTSQAGVYSKSANLFAPYYRQTSFVALNPEENMYDNQYFRIGANDVAAAFDHYLKHLNQDRPFILAGHSQGSLVMIDLIRKKLKDPSLQKKLVAAYLIGYSVMPEDFKKYPWMKPATGGDDTGVIISYNTQAPGATGSPVLVKGAFCINPLNWKPDATPAGKELNKGAVFFDDFTGTPIKEVPHYTGARINTETGALETVPPDLDQLKLGHFPDGVLHKFDYAFWYRNLQDNVAQRIRNYLNPAEPQ
jgi:pimeloyl-ACP methyl ester carboxylesterase